jgi:hypothetical protein
VIKSVGGASTSAGPSDKTTADAGRSTTNLPISWQHQPHRVAGGIYDTGGSQTSNTTATAGTFYLHLPHDR